MNRKYPLTKKTRKATSNFMESFYGGRQESFDNIPQDVFVYDKTSFEETEEIKHKAGMLLIWRIEKRLKQAMDNFPFDSWESNYYYRGYSFMCHHDGNVRI